MVSLALPGPVGAAPAGAARPRIAAVNPPARPDVNVAALAAPVVNVAALAAPVVNVAALAAPVVNVAALAAPVVNVAALAAPVVNVAALAARVVNPNFVIVWVPSFSSSSFVSSRLLLCFG